MDDACDTIIRALNTRGGRKDDVALLMARLNGIAPEDVAEWRLSPSTRPRSARARAAGPRPAARLGPADALPTTAELLVSELVTNAVRHSPRPRDRAAPGPRGDALLCEVDGRRPDPADAAQRGPGRRVRAAGCASSARLAQEWGTSRTGRGKTVWFEQVLTPRQRTL